MYIFVVLPTFFNIDFLKIAKLKYFPKQIIYCFYADFKLKVATFLRN